MADKPIPDYVWPDPAANENEASRERRLGLDEDAYQAFDPLSDDYLESATLGWPAAAAVIAFVLAVIVVGALWN